MVYRIRYRSDSNPSGGEMNVEANSPAEAMVKFRHCRQGPDDSRQRNSPHIVSVLAEGNPGETW